MSYPCLYCIFNTKRCISAKAAQETGYCKWLQYFQNEEELVE